MYDENTIIRKVPLNKEIPVTKVDFGDIDNLCLEFLENRKKLKPEYADEELPDAQEIQRAVRNAGTIMDKESDESDHGDNEPEQDDEDEGDDEGVLESESEEEPKTLDEIDEGELESSKRKSQKKPKLLTKGELLTKFRLLKKMYPNEDIPEVDEYMTYEELQKLHSDTVKSVTIDSRVSWYKTLMTFMFVGLEMGGGWVGVPLDGFTFNQLAAMNTYHSLLVELGAKYGSDEESSWPVEVRLCAMIFMQAAIFAVVKLISQKGVGGAPLAGLIQNLFGGSHIPQDGMTGENMPPNDVTFSSQGQHKEMRPPSIRPEELDDPEEVIDEPEEDIKPRKGKKKRKRA